MGFIAHFVPVQQLEFVALSPDLFYYLLRWKISVVSIVGIKAITSCQPKDGSDFPLFFVWYSLCLFA